MIATSLLIFFSVCTVTPVFSLVKFVFFFCILIFNFFCFESSIFMLPYLINVCDLQSSITVINHNSQLNKCSMVNGLIFSFNFLHLRLGFCLTGLLIWSYSRLGQVFKGKPVRGLYRLDALASLNQQCQGNKGMTIHTF